jgi:hypothetical protein
VVLRGSACKRARTTPLDDRGAGMCTCRQHPAPWERQTCTRHATKPPRRRPDTTSLPNYPGAAMREIIRQSGHPHNLEPLLLTLRRPANAAARRRFAEVGGELVLIQKVCVCVCVRVCACACLCPLSLDASNTAAARRRTLPPAARPPAHALAHTLARTHTHTHTRTHTHTHTHTHVAAR